MRHYKQEVGSANESKGSFEPTNQMIQHIKQEFQSTNGSKGDTINRKFSSNQHQAGDNAGLTKECSVVLENCHKANYRNILPKPRGYESLGQIQTYTNAPAQSTSYTSTINADFVQAIYNIGQQDFVQGPGTSQETLPTIVSVDSLSEPQHPLSVSNNVIAGCSSNANNTSATETPSTNDAAKIQEVCATILSKVDPKDVVCPLCQRKFPRWWNLKRHMLTHTGQKDFSCPVCQKKFSLKHQLKLHTEGVHGFTV